MSTGTARQWRHWNRTIARLRIYRATRRQVWTYFIEVEQRALHRLAGVAFPVRERRVQGPHSRAGNDRAFE
jgi:hypothetical protein